MRLPALHHRALGALMNAYVKVQLGYGLPFAAELFDTYGVAGFGEWAHKTADARDRAQARWGDAAGDMLVALTAAWNGCRWCSKGHLRAANLVFLRETGALFPLDEANMDEWQTLRDADLVQLLTKALRDADLHDQAEALQRLFDLRAGRAEATSEDDKILMDLVAAWDLLSECSVLVDVPEVVPALETELARDLALNEHYERLRQA